MDENRKNENKLNLIETNPPLTLFDNDELALKRGIGALYKSGCTVEVARRFVDLFPQSDLSKSPDNSEWMLAAVVYLDVSHQVMAICVFVEDWTSPDLDDLRGFCESGQIRLYPIERLQVYQLRVFERAILAEQFGLTTRKGYLLADNAACPYCKGPLIHRYIKEKYGAGYRGLFSCLQFYGESGEGGRCNGFCCTEEELLQYIEPTVLHFRHRVQSEVQQVVDSVKVGDADRT